MTESDLQSRMSVIWRRTRDHATGRRCAGILTSSLRTAVGFSMEAVRATATGSRRGHNAAKDASRTTANALEVDSHSRDWAASITTPQLIYSRLSSLNCMGLHCAIILYTFYASYRHSYDVFLGTRRSQKNKFSTVALSLESTASNW